MTRLLGAAWLLLTALACLPAPVSAEPRHGIAMYGEPALPPDFVSLPYANPDAPKGGMIVFGETGSFDSLNPYILKGTAPAAIQSFVFETLMARNWDEPFGLYGLLGAHGLALGREYPRDRQRDAQRLVLRNRAQALDLGAEQRLGPLRLAGDAHIGLIQRSNDARQVMDLPAQNLDQVLAQGRFVGAGRDCNGILHAA